MATITEEDAQAAELARVQELGARAAAAAGDGDDLDLSDASLEAEAEARAAAIEEGAAPAAIPPMKQPIPGLLEAIDLNAGGAIPTSSEMRLMGGSLPVTGAYEKGTTLKFVVEVKVGAVEFVDKTDDWGTVERTVRRHKARLLSVTPHDD